MRNENWLTSTAVRSMGMVRSHTHISRDGCYDDDDDLQFKVAVT